MCQVFSKATRTSTRVVSVILVQVATQPNDLFRAISKTPVTPPKYLFVAYFEQISRIALKFFVVFFVHNLEEPITSYSGKQVILNWRKFLGK